MLSVYLRLQRATKPVLNTALGKWTVLKEEQRRLTVLLAQTCFWVFLQQSFKHAWTDSFTSLQWCNCVIIYLICWSIPWIICKMADCSFAFPYRTLIMHTKALDPTRPVTYITDSNYARDKGVSQSSLFISILAVLKFGKRNRHTCTHLSPFQSGHEKL